jgi:hypothetical protein
MQFRRRDGYAGSGFKIKTRERLTGSSAAFYKMKRRKNEKVFFASCMIIVPRGY